MYYCFLPFKKWSLDWILNLRIEAFTCLFITEAFRTLHLYNDILLYVLTYSIFILSNILYCMEMSFHELDHLIIIDQFSCYLQYRIEKIKSFSQSRKKCWHRNKNLNNIVISTWICFHFFYTYCKNIIAKFTAYLASVLYF